jgi:hypothetical protein
MPATTWVCARDQKANSTGYFDCPITDDRLGISQLRLVQYRNYLM